MVDHLNNLLELRFRKITLLAESHHDPHHFAVTERHAHATAYRRRQRRGQQVIKFAGERNGKHNLYNGHVIIRVKKMAS